ncbi:helix-turn-helix transcriptional regulator [Rhizobium sp. YIM 134829]|uniref:helix-turn-helix transcriptional regulator n=1 Tax=Rhizobium sp. YIM 134829 TaxID=3390453 RepID=UPI0039784DFA
MTGTADGRSAEETAPFDSRIAPEDGPSDEPALPGPDRVVEGEREMASGTDLAADVAALQTQFDVVRYLRRLAEDHGFRHFIICLIPPIEVAKLSETSIVSNLPKEMLASFDESGLLQHSAGFRRLRSTTTPFCLSQQEWTRETTRAAEAAQHMAVSARHQVEQVAYFPVHNADGTRAAMILMGEQRAIPMAEMMELQMVAIYLYNRLTEIGAFWRESDVALSEREIQCLNWTAAGKTSAEIAGILGLSEHTVNHYLNHVTKKLNAVNRTQAVVKALRRGLIS